MVASLRHTCIVVGLYCAMGLYGFFVQRAAGPDHQLVTDRGSALPLYLGLIVAEWALLWYVLVGMRKYGARMGELLGTPWARGGKLVRDFALAIGFWALWYGAELAVARILGDAGVQSYDSLLPRGPLRSRGLDRFSRSARDFVRRRSSGVISSTSSGPIPTARPWR